MFFSGFDSWGVDLSRVYEGPAYELLGVIRTESRGVERKLGGY